MKQTLILLTFFIFATQSFASSAYYKLSKKSLSVKSEQCLPLPDTESCIKAACSNLPNYKCDDLSEIQVIGRFCANNYGSDCLKTLFSRLPSYRKDDLEEIEPLALACRNVYGSSCVKFIIEKLPSHRTDDADELIEIANSCKNN